MPRQWPVNFYIEEKVKGVPHFKVTESKVPKKYDLILLVVSVQPIKIEPFTSRMKYSGRYSIPRHEAYYEYGFWIPADGMRTVNKIIQDIEQANLTVECVLIAGTGDITTLLIKN